MAEKRKDRLDRRQDLLRTAACIFAEKGYHPASVQEIAAGAGVATGTFYLYFPSKEALFHALMQSLYEQVVESVLEARSECEDEPVAKLTASLQAAIRVFAVEPDLARVVLLQAGGARPGFTEELSAIHRTLSLLIESDLEEAVEQERIAPLDVPVAARAFLGAAYELVMSWLGEGVPNDLQDALPHLVRFNLQGIGAWKDSTAGRRNGSAALIRKEEQESG